MNEEKTVKTKNVLRNKNFALVFLGALVSNIASLFYSFAVSFHILKITGNNAFIQGLYLAVSGVIFCIFSLFGGVISDRFNKAKIMYICDYLKGITIIGFTLLLMFVIEDVDLQIIALFVVAVISNAIAGIFTPASSALLPIIVEEESYQQAQSYFSILSSFQAIIGVVIAGILYSFVPINILFLIVGVFYIFSAISEMFIKYNTDSEKRNEKLTMGIVFGDIKDGLKYLMSIKPILILMLCILFINFFFSPIFENFSPYFISTDVASSNYMFKDALEPEMWSSFSTMAYGVGSLVMGIVLSILPQKEKCNVKVRYSLLGVTIVLILLSISYILFKQDVFGINAVLIIMIVSLLIIGVLVVLINVPATTTMMRMVDKDKFGKVSSVINIGSQGLIPLSLFLGGLALTYIGSVGLLVVCSIGFMITVAIIFLAKSIREL